jgi:hypothetical protein
MAPVSEGSITGAVTLGDGIGNVAQFVSGESRLVEGDSVPDRRRVHAF